MKTIRIHTLLLAILIGFSSPYLMAAKKNKAAAAKKNEYQQELEQRLIKARQEANYAEISEISVKHQRDFVDLLSAINKNNVKLIKTLLASNPLLAYMGRKEYNYATPLMCAVYNANMNTLTSLLQIEPICKSINVTDTSRETALMCAVQSENYDKVTQLLDAGADSNLKNFTDNTPLMVAIGLNNKKIFDLLLPLCKNIDSKNETGTTLLILATETSNRYMMQKLIDAGADINAKNNLGLTPLMYAAINNNEASIQTLLNAKASIDTQDNHNNTALSIAQQHGHTTITQLLLAEHNARRAFYEAQANADRAFSAGHQENQEEKNDREAPKDDAQVPAVEPMMPQEADRPQENNPNQPILRKCIGCNSVQMGSKKTIRQAAQESADSQPLFKFCAGCPQEPDLSKRSYYCTVECQTKHWPTHKQTCARIDIKDDTESTSEDDQPEDTLSTQKEQCAHAQEGNYDGPCPHCHPDFFCD